MAKYNWCPHPNDGEVYGLRNGKWLGWLRPADRYASLFGFQLAWIDADRARFAIERGVADAEDLLFRPAAPAITLPAGWVAHTPYLAERTADRVVVVMDAKPAMSTGEAFASSQAPGAGRFGAFSTLRRAVEFYDKQWSARPAGWTWQAADENHGPHWRRDADGYRVTETLDQWRGVTPDGYMTTGYYKTAEAVMTFAEQTRPVK